MALTIISKDLPIAPVGLEYAEQLQAIDGSTPFTWSLVSGSLPPGMVLSSSGLLTAAIGAIPADATGTYTFRLKVVDALLAEDYHDYSFEVAPQAYERVPEFLLDPRLRELFGNLLLSLVTREKVERHFFRDLIGAINATFVHHDADIYVPDWKTAGNNVALRTALNDLYAATIAAIKTISSISPDPAGNFDLTVGSGLTLTAQPFGMLLDIVPGAAGGVQEANVEADVSPGSSQSLIVPDLPDVVEIWVRDEFDASWDRLSEMSEALTKKVSQPDPSDPTKFACAVGCDATGALSPYLFTCHYDPAGPALVVNKYNGESMALIEIGLFPLSGPAVCEPLLMINRFAPFEPIVAVITGAPGAQVLEYAEFADPDNISGGLIRSNIFLATDLDNTAIEFLPNEMSGYDPLALQIHGAIIDTGATPEALLAPKISVAPGGLGQHNAVFLRIPIGVATPIISVAASLGVLSTDTLDVVFDGSVVPNEIYALNATGRWTNGGGTLDLWKLASAGWTPVPVPPPVGPLPAPPLLWSQTVVSPPTDGMECPKGMIALDVNPATKDAVSVVYVSDLWHNPGNLGTPVGPDLHTPSLAWARYDVVSSVVAPTSQGAELLDQQVDVALDAFMDGRFGRWWQDDESASVFFLNPKRAPGRSYVGMTLVDTGGMKSHVDNVHNLANPATLPITGGWVRPAHSTSGTSSYIRQARATAQLISTLPPNVLALDSPAKPNPFRTYYDGSANVVFQNESPFEWHVKIEALLNEVDPRPPNLSVACWQLAQGFQNYYNANSYFPSASCNPPGPGGAQGTVWDESETGTILTSGVAFYPTYYSVTPGGWDMNGGVTASAYYYSIGAAGASTSMYLVFRYAFTPSTILAAEAVIDVVLAAGPLPAPGVYTLSQIATAMGHPEWVTNYAGAPYDNYQYFCFVNSAGAGYYHGWFAQNYILNAQVYGPGAPGIEPSIPFVEKFTVPSDDTPGVPHEFTISRFARYAEVFVNGIAYWEGDDWEWGATLNKIRYLNDAANYVLHQDDRLIVKYVV